MNLAVLCDAANVSREGKLNVLGEFDSIHASTFPLTYPTMVLVVRLEAHPTEAGDHTLRLHLNDEDGQDVVPPLQGEFPTGDPPFLGVPIRTAPLILQMHGVRFEQPGHYSFELLVDGHHLRSLALHVVAGDDVRRRPGLMSRAVRVCTLAQLDAAGGLLPVAHGGREAVVVRAGTGEVFAVARACPHEGYPLEQGEVVGETITCPWHGWRFDLRSGACLTPGEDTQTFPVAIREDEVLVDLDVEFGAGRTGTARRCAGLGARVGRRGARGAQLGPAAGRRRDADRHRAAARTLRREPRRRARTRRWRRRRRAGAGGARAGPDRAPARPGGVDRRRARRPRGSALPGRAGQPFRRGASGRGRSGDRRQRRRSGIRTAPRRWWPERSSAARDPRAVAVLLARAASERFRGARPLALVERAARLAALDRDVARLALPAVARDVAATAPRRRRRPLRRARARGRADRRARPGSRRVAGGVRARARDGPDGRRVAARRRRSARIPAGGRLEHEHARPLAGGLACGGRTRLAGRPARARIRSAPADLVARAADAGQSPAGAAIILAATYAALELGVPETLAGVTRLVDSPRRERFVSRTLRDAHGRSSVSDA